MQKNYKDKVATAIASSNIAFIKYWGKRDSSINLPNNSSISMTLDSNVSTITSIMFTDRLSTDTIFINDERQKFEDSTSEKLKFIKKALDYSRTQAGIDLPALIVSKNNFPTSSGLASSASGGAALIYALNDLLGLRFSLREMSIAARRISGSACRSLYGGVVEWRSGKAKDGTDSYASQIVDERYWPDLIDIIAITDSSIKKVPSSIGHELTPKTSSLYKERLNFAKAGFSIVKKAVVDRNFEMLANAIMRESNNMHATMLDTFPPIIYLNDKSKEIIYAVHELNKGYGKCIAAYTFDAGPNAHIITTKKHKEQVFEMLQSLKIRKTIISGIGHGPTAVKNSSLINDRIFSMAKM